MSEEYTSITQSSLNKSRLDKFLLVLEVPPIMKNRNTSNPLVPRNAFVNRDTLQFSVFGSVIPRISVPPVEAPYAGGTYKLSSNSRPPYDDITVNFTIDNKFNNYWVIYQWLNILSGDAEIIYNPDDQLTSIQSLQPESYKLNPKLQPQAYQTNFTIYGKDEFDNNVVKFTYTKAFPVFLNTIDYNYREPGEIETSFTFAFSQFIAELV
jgi:hypothetical protein